MTTQEYWLFDFHRNVPLRREEMSAEDAASRNAKMRECNNYSWRWIPAK
jgi:hypothetical protein